MAAGGLGARYDLGPDDGLVAAVRGIQTRYVHPVAGAPDRDSVGLAALAGIASSGDGVWRYSLLAGLEARRFAASPQSGGQGTRATPVADVQVQWLPSEMTSVGLRLTRAMEESAWLTAPGSTNTRVNFAIEHEYLRDIILRAHTGVQVAELSGGNGTRVSGNVGGRVIWLVNRNMQLSLSYDLARWNEGILEAAPHDTQRLRNLVLASVRLVP